MFGFGKKTTHNDLAPCDLKAMIEGGTAIVVDVREPEEFADGHIAGAINMPLSRFDPAKLPASNGKTLVLNCAGGRRSATALDRCAAAGAAIDTHLAGGIGAWKSANLPLVTGA